MRRRVLLAVVFCVAAWAALAHITRPSAEPERSAAAGDVSPHTLTAAPASTDDSDSRWDVGHRGHVAITESLWKSAVVHADLAGAKPRDAFDPTIVVRRRDLARHDSPPPPLHVSLRI